MNKKQLLVGDDFKENYIDFISTENRLTKKRVYQKRASRKLKGAWPDEKVFRLIAIVEQRPALWNVAYARNKVATNPIWQEVAMELGDNDWIDCRIKWQQLRVTYKANLDKLQKIRSEQGTDVCYKVRWQFFYAMRFIGTICYSVNLEPTESWLEIILMKENELGTSGGEAPGTASAVASTQTQSVRETFELALSLIARSIDEHTVFGDHIASESRRLSDEDALILKQRITRVLLDFLDERALSSI